MRKHKDGDRLYLKSGAVVSFVGMFGKQYIVRRVMHEEIDEEDDPEDESVEILGDPVAVDEVFVGVPTQTYAAQIKTLDQSMANKRAQLAELESAIRQATRGQDEARRAVAVHTNIDRLADWLAGRTLWFALCRYTGNGISVKQVGREASLSLERTRDANDKETVKWWYKISGDSYEIAEPFATPEEAEKAARSMVSAALGKSDLQLYQLESLVESARRLKMTLEPKWEAAIRDAKIQAQSRALAEAELKASAERRKYEALVAAN